MWEGQGWGGRGRVEVGGAELGWEGQGCGGMGRVGLGGQGWGGRGVEKVEGWEGVGGRRVSCGRFLSRHPRNNPLAQRLRGLTFSFLGLWV